MAFVLMFLFCNFFFASNGAREERAALFAKVLIVAMFVLFAIFVGRYFWLEHKKKQIEHKKKQVELENQQEADAKLKELQKKEEEEAKKEKDKKDFLKQLKKTGEKLKKILDNMEKSYILEENIEKLNEDLNKIMKEHFPCCSLYFNKFQFTSIFRSLFFATALDNNERRIELFEKFLTFLYDADSFFNQEAAKKAIAENFSIIVCEKGIKFTKEIDKINHVLVFKGVLENNNNLDFYLFEKDFFA